MDEKIILALTYILYFLVEFAVFALIPASIAYAMGGNWLINFLCLLGGLFVFIQWERI